MSENTLQEIRNKLNELIESGADPAAILELSVELDKYIEQYMEKQKNNNCA